jgi:hypothetical protein
MTVCSLCWITLIGCSLGACVNQYTSPDGEVENTSTEPRSGDSHEPSEPTRPPNEPSDTRREATDSSDDAKRAPTEASGSCDDRSCVSTSDCCSGYQCAFDPERSKVTRYCLAQ